MHRVPCILSGGDHFAVLVKKTSLCASFAIRATKYDVRQAKSNFGNVPMVTTVTSLPAKLLILLSKVE